MSREKLSLQERWTMKKWLQASVIAALYAAVTIAAAPISYGVMQVRISEGLAVIPAITGAGIPGLFIGCLIANLLGPYGIIDVVCGSLATLIGAYGAYKLKNRPFLVPLPTVVANAVIIGAMLNIAYNVKINIFACMGWVGLGELISCYIIGIPLYHVLKKYEGVFK